MRNLKIESGRIVSCERMDSPTMTQTDGKILENLPPRTIVKIILNPAEGSNINVEIWLPDAENWNGRFVGHGNGGAAGNINAGSMIGQFTKNCAVATTDMGTSPDSDSGIGNPEVWKDFGYRATHLMTTVSKQVIEEFYGKAPEYSYFLGGSTGGQQGLQEAQRYPEDYDGIVAMVPAHGRTPLHAYFLWNYQILQACPFSEDQEKSVIAAANEYMADREPSPTAGKFVTDPRCDASDIEAVIDLARKKDSTLGDKHAEALRRIFEGPTNSTTGERIFGGVPLGSTFNNAAGNLYLFRWVFGADKDFADIDFDKDIDTYTATLGPLLNAENPDLSRFEKNGGKIFMASGSADPIVPYHATLDYYERVIDHFGSIEKVKSFFTFYMVPGKDHGGNGPGITTLENTFDIIVNWRENGVAPGMIKGERKVEEKVEFSMPIYPYPALAEWDDESGYKQTTGPRGGVERVSERFRPEAAE
ncbi:MAG: tannase/feruloyl esterase family alpha/beta hydrolase [Planctomycetes bacterium]|nr:tannase/feruloyl esterase family alpha/beta hydrolase [Planctomycetota bacterium]